MTDEQRQAGQAYVERAAGAARAKMWGCETAPEDLPTCYSGAYRKGYGVERDRRRG